MSTVIDAVKARVQAAGVGGRCWLDELMVRANEHGVVGAHAILQWRAPDALGNETGGAVGPLDVPVLADDPLWQQVVADINTAALDSVNRLTSDLAAMTTQRDTAVQLFNQASTELTTANAQISEAATVIADLRQQLAALQAE